MCYIKDGVFIYSIKYILLYINTLNFVYKLVFLIIYAYEKDIANKANYIDFASDVIIAVLIFAFLTVGACKESRTFLAYGVTAVIVHMIITLLMCIFDIWHGTSWMSYWLIVDYINFAFEGGLLFLAIEQLAEITKAMKEEKLKQKRLKQEKLKKDKLAQEKLLQEKIERERLAHEKLEKEKNKKDNARRRSSPGPGPVTERGNVKSRRSTSS